jgi:ABC-type branched-subunit amino acid transport system ATPase component
MRRLILTPESRGIFPGLTVEENLSLTMPDAVDRESAYERFPSLAARRQLAAGSLSGGEQQMLSLAAQLVSPPTVLVADEPTLGLAPRVVEEISRIFCELRDRGVALLLVAEKARAVLEIADQVTFLELGRVVWAGPRLEVTAERLRASYLGAKGRTESVIS